MTLNFPDGMAGYAGFNMPQPEAHNESWQSSNPVSVVAGRPDGAVCLLGSGLSDMGINNLP
jgi:hypothetical protein